jgi:hypothetical protein
MRLLPEQVFTEAGRCAMSDEPEFVPHSPAERAVDEIFQVWHKSSFEGPKLVAIIDAVFGPELAALQAQLTSANAERDVLRSQVQRLYFDQQPTKGMQAAADAIRESFKRYGFEPDMKWLVEVMNLRIGSELAAQRECLQAQLAEANERIAAKEQKYQEWLRCVRQLWREWAVTSTADFHQRLSDLASLAERFYSPPSLLTDADRAYVNTTREHVYSENEDPSQWFSNPYDEMRRLLTLIDKLAGPIEQPSKEA